VSLVLGILSMMTTCFPLGLVGIWLGAKARREAREAGERSGGPNDMMGLIGMILGGIFGGLWGLYWLFNIVMVIFGFGLALIPIFTG
jgi:hypothetical protein